jgi:hypothetical protein
MTKTATATTTNTVAETVKRSAGLKSTRTAAASAAAASRSATVKLCSRVSPELLENVTKAYIANDKQSLSSGVKGYKKVALVVVLCGFFGTVATRYIRNNPPAPPGLNKPMYKRCLNHAHIWFYNALHTDAELRLQLQDARNTIPRRTKSCRQTKSTLET